MIRALFRSRAPAPQPHYGYTEREIMEAAWNGPLGSPTHKVDWQIVHKPGSNQFGLIATKGGISATSRALTDRIRAIKRNFIESLYRGDHARL